MVGFWLLATRLLVLTAGIVNIKSIFHPNFIEGMRVWHYQLRKLASAATKPREVYMPVIGLEVHVQLRLHSKLFSRAPAGTEAGPNSQVALLDMSFPGTLPRLNREAVMHGLRMAHVLNCEIPSTSRFDRKHYFYADMPAGYQITQKDHPVARNGLFDFFVYGEGMDGYRKEVGIIQLQLEQDSGKTIHHGNTSLVDLNRAGSALVEVVTAPDLTTAQEAVCFVQQLRLLLKHYGICDGEMHKGQLRVDANVSLSENGELGVRTEVKNMNSIRHLSTAINFELDRQYQILSSGGRVENETRACDQMGRTVSMRDKEEVTDYRFMPEPNLPMLKIRPDWIGTTKKEIGGSEARYLQLIRIGFPARTAVHYDEEPDLDAFVSRCYPSGVSPAVSAQTFITWLKELKTIMQRSKAVYPPKSERFANEFMKILEVYEKDKITRLRTLELLRTYANDKETRNVEQVLEEDNLWRIKEDSDDAKTIVEKVMEGNNKLVVKARNGHEKSMSKLRNAVIESSRKRIDVDDATRLVRSRLDLS